jgi:hypothetical protein
MYLGLRLVVLVLSMLAIVLDVANGLRGTGQLWSIQEMCELESLLSSARS